MADLYYRTHSLVIVYIWYILYLFCWYICYCVSDTCSYVWLCYVFQIHAVWLNIYIFLFYVIIWLCFRIGSCQYAVFTYTCMRRDICVIRSSCDDRNFALATPLFFFYFLSTINLFLKLNKPYYYFLFSLIFMLFIHCNCFALVIF